MLAGRGNQRKPPIRAPRRALNSDDVNFESVWVTLASSFREIHTRNASSLSFEELYRSAYVMVLKKKGELLYNRVQDFIREWLSRQVLPQVQHLLSGNLLVDPQLGLGATANERRIAGERFLKGLKQAWQDHQVCMRMLTDVLMYMDRTYCQDYKRPSIYVASMAIFRDCILRSRVSEEEDSPMLLAVLNGTILEQIQMERDGDIIDKHLIKSCVYMLEGLYETTLEREEEKLYLTAFEQEFLIASREFYNVEGESLIRQSDAGSYCRHTKKRLVEEQDRCRSTLSVLTALKIQVVVEDELIKHKIQDLIEMESGVQFMVANDRLDELALIYDLNKRVDVKKEALTHAIQREIQKLGDAVNDAAAAAGQAQPAAPPYPNANEDKSKPAPERNTNQQMVAALVWVEEALALKDKFDRIWEAAFESDQLLQTEMTRNFTDFVNGCSRSSEYISLFIDENMKKGLKGKTELEVDVVLEKAIVLQRYLRDKDLFERYYKKHLSKRLLMGKSLSTDIEKQMISRMKIELGNNFTLKLEAMFKDMALSEELTTGYKKRVSQLGDPDPQRVEFAVHVLTTMIWPLEAMGAERSENGLTQMQCNYPGALERVKRGFEQFYSEQYTGRVLRWQANMGTADIRATFPKVPTKDGFKERKHEINVSTYAMLILLLFNDVPSGESLTFEDIQARTKIPNNELIRNLQSLAVAPKTRVLIKEPMSKDVNPTDKFSFNEGFMSKFHKLKIGVVAGGNKVETEKERQVTEEKNDEQRAKMIEAAAVRIMKDRKIITHQQLLSETITVLASSFKPEVTMIKQRLESLLDREYLARVEDAAVPSYRYVA